MGTHTRPDLAGRRRRAWGAAIVGVGLVLAGCGDAAEPPEPGASSTPTVPQPVSTAPTPSDAGTVEITETGFTVVDQRESLFDVVWAATFRNTSRTDLLAYVDFEITLRGADGEAEQLQTTTAREQRAYDVLPGDTAVVGFDYVVDFPPESLEVSVETSEWVPMADLQARDLPVGVEVTGQRIDVDTNVLVHVDFVSSYATGGDDNLRITVALRDSAGELLGAAWAEGDFAATPAGERQQRGHVDGSWWPDRADPDTSQAMIVKVCCTWVGVT